MKLLAILISITLLMLNGCGASEPTFDGTSKEAAESSMMKMFPDIDFDDDGPSEEAMKNLPPALETYMCKSIEIMFSNFGQNEEESLSEVREIFNGMTVDEMEAYGIENDLIGCISGMMEGLKELEEGLKELENMFE